MIKIENIYEEASYRPYPEWTGDPEDKRLFDGPAFGAQGEAWATIATIHLQETFRFLGRPMRITEVLQLRVCSRKFVESDPRFLWGGRHLAYFQDCFDWQDVVDYCQSVVGESSHLSGRTLFRALEQHFHVYDPDED